MDIGRTKMMSLGKSIRKSVKFHMITSTENNVDYWPLNLVSRNLFHPVSNSLNMKDGVR